MKAQELRIGNYVKLDKSITIDENYILIISLKENIINNTSSESFNPISLTEKWLIDFGFEEVFNELEEIYIYKKGNFVYVNENQIGTGIQYNQRMLIDNDINEVHKLQNIYLALTGKELIKK